MMNDYKNLLCREPEKYSPFMDELKILFAAMDQKYNEVSGTYDFTCTGCRDNCCQTRFYHHTYLEFIYLREGLDRLDPEKRIESRKRALQVCDGYRKADVDGIKKRLMCPLNFEGLCIVYLYRPMICRLHGIAHEINPPGRPTIFSPGCEDFTRHCEERGNADGYTLFDRTPFYANMSKLEQNLRQTIGIEPKLKKTIAEMVVLLT